jgi:hypothetical protein
MTGEPDPSFEPVITDILPPPTEVGHAVTESGRHIPLSDSLLQKERKHLSLAPSFDRLIAVNLELTTSVSRLVRVTYAMIALQILT